jgi:hypothetical protein
MRLPESPDILFSPFIAAAAWFRPSSFTLPSPAGDDLGQVDERLEAKRRPWAFNQLEEL